MTRATLFQLYKLTSDTYSEPKGSIGYVDQDFENGTVFMAWIPKPLGISRGPGGSGPISMDDLEHVGELLIDKVVPIAEVVQKLDAESVESAMDDRPGDRWLEGYQSALDSIRKWIS